MTDISNHNKKAKFLDVLSPSIWPNLPQALVSKMPAKKREPWKPKEHSQAFQRSLRRESIQVSTLPCLLTSWSRPWLPHGNLPFYWWRSLRLISCRSQGRVREFPVSRVTLLWSQATAAIFWAGILGAGVGLGSDVCDRRKDLSGAGKAFYAGAPGERSPLWLCTLPRAEMRPGTGRVVWWPQGGQPEGKASAQMMRF